MQSDYHSCITLERAVELFSGSVDSPSEIKKPNFLPLCRPGHVYTEFKNASDSCFIFSLPQQHQWWIRTQSPAPEHILHSPTHWAFKKTLCTGMQVTEVYEFIIGLFLYRECPLQWSHPFNQFQTHFSAANLIIDYSFFTWTWQDTSVVYSCSRDNYSNGVSVHHHANKILASLLLGKGKVSHRTKAVECTNLLRLNKWHQAEGNKGIFHESFIFQNNQTIHVLHQGMQKQCGALWRYSNKNCMGHVKRSHYFFFFAQPNNMKTSLWAIVHSESLDCLLNDGD